MISEKSDSSIEIMQSDYSGNIIHMVSRNEQNQES